MRIKKLENQVQLLKASVFEWEAWWHLNFSRGEDDEASGQHWQQQQQQQRQWKCQDRPCEGQGTPSGGIDYSRWEHLSCYSSSNNATMEEEAEEENEEKKGGSDWGADFDDKEEYDEDEEAGEEEDEEEEEEGKKSESAFTPNVVEEEKESETEIESTLDADLANNKAIVLGKMEETKRKIIRAQARLEAPRFSGKMQQQQRQIESYLEMATQLDEQEYKEDGSKALLGMLMQWQSEALQHIQGWMEEALLEIEDPPG